ncbi:Rossmann-like and DUF2520 domain-containing protein [Sediminivirga luteola]|uniref:Oxidoreductase n=1 Tax=Sediminivirga luteola TaxID=1774748 RepID=A0A8J2TTQ4_9MICO|nr:DUF2520 domain-containing protein [Sediminivirga luteola]MCI2264765.1 DUF2520 domain-containing protein [Sediminivirga luteola]GGA01884.1 oxidoreductase [Sediminivirga luteola]
MSSTQDGLGRDSTRLGAGIIGCGRVGAVIGAALRGAGHAVIGVSATSEASRERADAMLPGVPVLEIPEIVERAELLMVTVSDDAIGPLVSGLAKGGHFQEGQIVAHWAGRFGTEVLRPAAEAGAITIAFHPSLSFTGTSIDLPRLREATVGVTAAKPVLPIGQALVVEMGAEPVILAEADRALYHAAICHASNHVVTVLSQAMRTLESLGVDQPSRVLDALVTASVRNTLESGAKALTGPVSRGDVSTVEAHLEALAEQAAQDGSTEILDAYRQMSRATAQAALQTGRITPETAERLLEVLADPGSRR